MAYSTKKVKGVVQERGDEFNSLNDMNWFVISLFAHTSFYYNDIGSSRF